MSLDRGSFETLARADFEFSRETRYLTGTIKLDFGNDLWALNFEDGALIEVGDGAGVDDSDCKIIVGGTSDQWDALLAPKPKPFFQCIQSAAVKHGMRISDSNETFAYLPGLNRMTTLLRQLKNGRA
ncbi:MAG: hypothetical protein AAF724_00275 [Pseudomonadota bacterium]